MNLQGSQRLYSSLVQLAKVERLILFELEIYQRSYPCRIWKKRLNTLQRPRNYLSSITFVGCCSSQIASAAHVDIPRLPGWIRWRKYLIQFSKKKYFFGFIDTQALENSPCTVRRWSMCPSPDLHNITTSSRYTSTDCHLPVGSIISIARWSVLGPVFIPNGIL